MGQVRAEFGTPSTIYLRPYRPESAWLAAVRDNMRDCIDDRCDIDDTVRDEEQCAALEGCSATCAYCAASASRICSAQARRGLFGPFSFGRKVVDSARSCCVDLTALHYVAMLR